MRFLLFAIIFIFISSPTTIAQQYNYGRNPNISKNFKELPFNPELKPFYHGVASGDPLSNRVIIWTRITPNDENPVEVFWTIATDLEFTNIVNTGTFITDQKRDYTVKIDVEGLSPATTYYYYFHTPDANSLIGRTRTTPDTDANQLRFAVVSCSNYQAGYFNAYKKIAQRKDLDAVIHLGDYIYEYGSGSGTYGYDASREDRANQPAIEILSLTDYRTRYSLYRLDPDLLAAHQQHPFIAIWDDHESANDSYKDGAENHGEEGKDEGSWEDRKAISKKVYFEWMPIRDETNFKINRTLSYGNLADIINIDTRLEGRDVQINDVTDAKLYAPDRTLLGIDQKSWLFDQLQNSKAQWKVIANQVIFSEFNVGWAAQSPQKPADIESMFLDIWDGYPAERDQVIDFITNNKIDNTIILTGDFHSSFAFDVSKRPSALSPGAPESITYDPESGEGSVAVEFAAPSITSANFDENIGAKSAAGIEFQINKPLPGVGINPNPHMKYTDLDQHGYFILDLNKNKAQADWFFTDILTKNDTESSGENWFVLNSQNHLQKAATASLEKQEQPELAPSNVPNFNLNVSEYNPARTLSVFGLYPNPLPKGERSISLQYGLTKKSTFVISVSGMDGKLIKEYLQHTATPGIYLKTIYLKTLPSGIYFINFKSSQFSISKKIVLY